jgi:hypothetical protein
MVCATFSDDPQVHIAGSFEVLSTSSPQVSISPNALKENQKETITATNYLPSGTLVTFYWATTSNTIVRTINSAPSDNSGTAQITYIVPVTSQASGQYVLEAIAGSGTPAPLSSSANFTYTKPTPTPSPTPSPKPSPTQNPTPVATATVKATVSATAAASPTAGTTPTSTINQATTPTVGTTVTATVTNVSGGNGTSSGPPSSILLLAATIMGSLVLLTVLPAAGLMLRRKNQRQLEMQRSPLLSDFPGAVWPVGLSMPGGADAPTDPFTAPLFPLSAQRNAPVTPVPAMAGQYAGMQSMAAGSGFAAFPPTSSSNGYTNENWQNGVSASTPQPYGSLLNPMAPAPGGPWPQNSNGKAPGAAMLLSADPELEAMRRKAQAGLYVSPTPGE